MKRTYLLLTGKIIVTGIFLSACTQNDMSYFPLQNGIEWHYGISLKASGAVERQKYYVHNTGSRSLEDEILYVQRSLTGLEVLYRKLESGIERVGYMRSQNQPGKLQPDPLLLIPASIEAGMEWENTIQTRLLIRKGAPGESAILAKVPAVNVIESLDETVTVPAGKFERCMRIDTNGFAFHSGTQHKSRTLVEIKQSRWYAPGVGLVKSTRLETSTSDAFGTREQTMELESVITH